MEQRKLPIGIQSFEEIRTNNYLYVDKTFYIWKLVQSGKVYFLSRPRRFGKSLLISTLEAYFRGKKELFHGLAIEEMENGRGNEAWREYPVITFSLSGGRFNQENGLEDAFNQVLEDTAEEYDLSGACALKGKTLPMRFGSLIRNLYRKIGRPVVVLVDEYDKPLLETMIINEKQEEENRQLYKEFFSVLKDTDAYLKFVFFTGVTKFSKVSIFSDLNQLNDISLDEDVSEICGITEDEMLVNFTPEIDALSKKQHLSIDNCKRKLAQTYDGYHFSAHGKGVYNPFSLLMAFSKRDFGNYWFETATPTFLIRTLRASKFTAEQFDYGVEVRESSLGNYRTDGKDPIPLFYQAGYLTICGYDPEFRIYKLKFPNNEVKYGFLESLMPSVLGEQDAESPVSAREMILDLRAGELSSFMVRLESLFGAIPYVEGQQKSYEQEWRNEIFLIFAMLGLNVRSEVHTANGRADCTVETQKYIYIFEFKVDKTADEALGQIEEKGYAVPYKADPRKVMKIGVNFSSEKRNIAEWKVEEE